MGFKFITQSLLVDINDSDKIYELAPSGEMTECSLNSLNPNKHNFNEIVKYFMDEMYVLAKIWENNKQNINSLKKAIKYCKQALLFSNYDNFIFYMHLSLLYAYSQVEEKQILRKKILQNILFELNKINEETLDTNYLFNYLHIRSSSKIDLGELTNDKDLILQSLDDLSILIENNKDILNIYKERAYAFYILTLEETKLSLLKKYIKHAINDYTICIQYNTHDENGIDLYFYRIGLLYSIKFRIDKNIESFQYALNFFQKAISITNSINNPKYGYYSALAEHTSSSILIKILNKNEWLEYYLESIKNYKVAINLKHDFYRGYLNLSIIYQNCYSVTGNFYYIEELINNINIYLEKKPLDYKAIKIKLSILFKFYKNEIEKIEIFFRQFCFVFLFEYNQKLDLNEKYELLDQYLYIIIEYISWKNIDKDPIGLINHIENSKSLIEKELSLINLDITNEDKKQELDHINHEIVVETNNVRSSKNFEKLEILLKKQEELYNEIGVQIGLLDRNLIKEVNYTNETLMKNIQKLYGDDTLIIYVYSIKDSLQFGDISSASGFLSIHCVDNKLEFDKSDFEDQFDETIFKINSLVYYIDKLIQFTYNSIGSKNNPDIIKLKKSITNKHFKQTTFNKTIEFLNTMQISEEKKLNELDKLYDEYDKVTQITNKIKELLKIDEDGYVNSLKEIFETIFKDTMILNIVQNFDADFDIKNNVDADTLNEEYDHFNTKLKYDLIDEALKPISKALLPKISQLKVKPKRIVFSGLGDPAQFPFHAMKDEDGEYLLKSIPILYTPSLSILSDEKLEKKKSDIAIATTVSDIKKDCLDEIDAISLKSIVTKSFTANENPLEYFTKDKEYNIFHYAGHGKTNISPLLSTLEYADNKHIEVKDLLTNNFNVDLVVLSACETNLSTDGIMGLDSAISFPNLFLAKGTKATVSTLFKINSNFIKEFMGYFYTNLNHGTQFDEAMQKSYIQWMSNNDMNKTNEQIITNEEKKEQPYNIFKSLLNKIGLTRGSSSLNSNTIDNVETDELTNINREWYFIVPTGRGNYKLLN